MSVLVLAAAAPVVGQTIYLPVQHQHRAPNGGGVFFYGGADPFVFHMATRLSVDPGFGRVSGAAFSSGTRTVHASRPPVYSDAAPGIDLAPFGYTPADAFNAAQRSVPTYFRMADVRAQAVRQPDGTRLVAPTAGGRPDAESPPPTTAEPAAPRGVILILPMRRPTGPALPQASVPAANHGDGSADAS
ncbi:MAG: hypothetical protein ACK4PI_04525 [Tepidisphaerales bacterium]